MTRASGAVIHTKDAFRDFTASLHVLLISAMALVVGTTGQLADKMAMTDTGVVPILDRATQKVVGVVALRDLIRVRAWRIREERERRRVLRLG